MARQLTEQELWMALREKADAHGLPPPAFSQAMGLFDEVERARKAKETTGLVHERYRHVRYATQECELDSTELQAFTPAELGSNVLLKNPTYYKLIDAKWEYVPATYLSYESSSNALLAEVVFRALTGMASVCAELGLPYTEEDFPAYRPGKKLWVDHQELTSPLLNRALLEHLGWQVAFAVVGKGADKGVVEGNIGHDKKTLARGTPGFFGKHALSEMIEQARRSAQGDTRALDRKLIQVTHDWNNRELPLDKVPKEFLLTGRPPRRVELYKWDLFERNRELIKPPPDEAMLPAILLPTEPRAVHVGKGIYVTPGRYYSSPELVAAGLLRRHGKGDTQYVDVAQHRGTVRFVYWARGPNDYVKCPLHARQEDALGDMTIAQAEEHMSAMPAVAKREHLREIHRHAAQSRSQDAQQQRKASSAASKGHATRDRNTIAAAKKAEIARQAKSDLHRRFPDLASGATTSTDTRDSFTDFEDEQAAATGRLVAKLLADGPPTRKEPS